MRCCGVCLSHSYLLLQSHVTVTTMLDCVVTYSCTNIQYHITMLYWHCCRATTPSKKIQPNVCYKYCANITEMSA